VFDRKEPVMAGGEFTSCRYGAAHDVIQPLGLHEPHNDSVYFNFVGPLDAGIAGGVIRIGLRPNEGYSEASVVIPIVGAGTLFHYKRSPLQPDGVPVGTPVWSSGPLRIESLEPTRRWRLRYDGDEARIVADTTAFAQEPGVTWRASETTPVAFDFDWQADFPVHVLSTDGSLLPDQESDDVVYGKNHLEQFGSLTGTLRVGERSWEISAAPGFRDHSWGPRVWESAPDQDFVTVYLDDGRRVATIANRIDGSESFHGIWFEPGDLTPTSIDRYELRTRYAGGPQAEAVGWTFGAGGREIRVDGDVVGFLPLRVGKHPVRIAQTLLRLSPDAPGQAKTDLTRPISPT
jgi:hypothetical protein